MLKSFRSSQSNIFVWIIILLLIVGLAGFGVSQSGGGGSATAVASVGEEEITVDEYVRAINRESRAIGQQLGRALTVDQMRTFGLDQQVMRQLINSAAIDNETNRLGLSVGDETLQQMLLSTREFQAADGRFDEQSYEFALQRANLTPAEYDDILRSETTRDLLRQGVVRGVRLDDTASQEVVKFLGQQRAVSWSRLDETNLDVPIGEPSEEELKEFHTSNEADYTLPETRRITYAYATEDSMLEEVEVTEEALTELFEDRQEQYNSPARRILDRIVFGTLEEAQAAKSLLDEGTSTFLEVATARGLLPEDIDQGEVTEEELSAEEGKLLFGSDELGVFGPVETSLGPALYQVNAVLSATHVTLPEVRDDLRRELAREEAAALISAETDAIDDLIAGGATIEEVASETILDLGTIAFTNESYDGLAADQAFRDEALDASEGEDRDLTNLSDGIFVLRVDEIVEPTLQPLEDVRLDVEAAWSQAETNSRLVQLANSLKERVDAGEQISGIASELGLEVKEEASLGRNDIVEDTPPQFVRDIFSANLGEAVVVEDETTVLIGVVTDVIPAEVEDAELSSQVAIISERLEQSVSNDLFLYFTQGIQNEAGIRVNQSLIQNVLGQLSTGG